MFNCKVQIERQMYSTNRMGLQNPTRCVFILSVNVHVDVTGEIAAKKLANTF